MTDQEINIAIAEECGWKLWPIVGWTPPGTKPPFTINSYPSLPNYCHDLNAMHEVYTEQSKQWSYEQIIRYRDCLFLAVGLNAHYYTGYHLPAVELNRIVNADARQRAEAFLRFKGLFKT